MKCKNDGFMKKPPFSGQRGRGGKVLLLLLTLALTAGAILSVLALGGCANREKADPGYMKFTQFSLSYYHDTGEFFIRGHWENVSSDKTLLFAEEGQLEYFDGRKWVPVKHKDGSYQERLGFSLQPLPFVDKDRRVAPGEAAEYVYYLNQYDVYDDVPFRLVTQYSDEGTGEVYTVYTEFEMGADVLDFFESTAPLSVDGKQSRKESTYYFFGEGTYVAPEGLVVDGQELPIPVIYESNEEARGLRVRLFDSAAYLAPLERNAYSDTWRYVISGYKDSFFEDNVLLTVGFATGSGSYQYTLDAITVENGTLFFDISLILTGMEHTADIGSVTLLIELDREAFEKCSDYEVRIKHN